MGDLGAMNFLHQRLPMPLFNEVWGNMMEFKKPKRIFEDSGIVDPASAYHTEMEDVVNTKGQDIKTMVDLGRYFSIFAPGKAGRPLFS